MIIAQQDTLLGANVSERNVNLCQPRDTHDARKNADDFVGNSVDEQMLAKNFSRSTKAFPPHLVTDERDLRAVRHIVGIREIASELRRDVEHLQEIRRDSSAADAFRCAAAFDAGKIVGLATEKGEIGEAVLGRAPIEIIRVADRAAGKARRPFANVDEAFRMWIRERT